MTARERWARSWPPLLAVVTVSSVGGPAAVASYRHARDVVAANGDPVMAPWLALTTDGMLLASLVVIWVRRHRGQDAGRGPWAAFWAGMTATVAANLAAAQPTLVGVVVALWPPVCLAITLELVALVAARGAQREGGSSRSREEPSGGDTRQRVPPATTPAEQRVPGIPEDLAGARKILGDATEKGTQIVSTPSPDLHSSEGNAAVVHLHRPEPGSAPDAPGHRRIPGDSDEVRVHALLEQYRARGEEPPGRRALARELGLESDYPVRKVLEARS